MTSQQVTELPVTDTPAQLDPPHPPTLGLIIPTYKTHTPSTWTDLHWQLPAATCLLDLQTTLLSLLPLALRAPLDLPFLGE